MQYRAGLDYDGLQLLGYNLYKLGYAHQKDEPFHPGDILHLDLYWQALRPFDRAQGRLRSGQTIDTPDTDWQLGLQLVDKGGQSRAIEGERPVGGSYGTSLWQAGEVVRDQRDLLIPADVPAGHYHLVGQVRPSVASEALSPFLESKELVIR